MCVLVLVHVLERQGDLAEDEEENEDEDEEAREKGEQEIPRCEEGLVVRSEPSSQRDEGYQTGNERSFLAARRRLPSQKFYTLHSKLYIS